MAVMQAGMNYIPPVRISYSVNAPVNWDEFGAMEETLRSLQFGATEETLRSLQFGNTIYRFFQEINLNNIRDYKTGDWSCWSSEIESSIVGNGDTSLTAREDFKSQLHTIFQRLYRKRPFEMDKQERNQWQRLISVIDVHNYRTTTPIIVQEVGQVSFGKIARPYRIKWLTGHNYIIDPSKVSPELMSMKPGQYVEAVVKRDSVTHKELEIISVKPISFHLPNNKNAERFWDEMPVADLPDGGWD